MPIIRQSSLLAATIALAAGATAAPSVLRAATADGSTAMPRAQSVTWSPKEGPVPRALTATSPALATLTFPGTKTADTLLFWAGPRAGGHGDRISFEHAISLSRNKWSAPATAGKAVTASAPSAAPYLSDLLTGFRTGDVIVTWRAGDQVQYEIGTGEKGGAVSWGPVFGIPGARTTGAPAVYSPLYAKAVLVTWKAADGSAVDYVIGSPGKGAGPVHWGSIGAIPRAAASTSPTVAEASTGSKTGRLYVFWRAVGSVGRIDYATTTDPLSAKTRWTAPVSLPPGIRTGAAPVAQAIGPPGGYPPPAGSYPLLIVYRAPHGSQLLYVTLPQKGPVSGQRVVPFLSSPESPALFNSVLAATDPPAAATDTHAGSGELFFVRPCGGC